VISGYESFLQLPSIAKEIQPELIIQIGQLPVSKYLLDQLEIWEGSTIIILTRFNSLNTANYQYHDFFQVEPTQFIDDVLSHSSGADTDSIWLKRLISIENMTWNEIEGFTKDHPEFEGSIVKSMIEGIGPKSALFISSSLAIRHVDQFVRYTEQSLRIFANRGASGIDGTLSSALGIALVHSGPTYLVSGDLSFYHDMNGLLAQQRYQISLSVVILNNQGGAIFDRLPVSKFDPPLTEFFLTPHHIAFDHISKAYGIAHEIITNAEAVNHEGIFEFRSEISHNRKCITELVERLKNRLVGQK
jgi:2-succinyl-5-enolpyruvyl-6-hydroxy-3-cyclohexene-1-carboxylate synthase